MTQFVTNFISPHLQILNSMFLCVRIAVVSVGVLKASQASNQDVKEASAAPMLCPSCLLAAVPGGKANTRRGIFSEYIMPRAD